MEPPAHRIPIVGVMGSGARAWRERAAPLGEHLARRGVHLLTGGGGGVMAAVSAAFHAVPERRGRVLGVLPGRGVPPAPPEGYPNPWGELPIRTHLPLSGRQGTDDRSRNHVNVLTSDALVVLPGSSGTLSEVALALRYRRPLVAWVRAADELPGLPPEVPRADDLEAVAAFLDALPALAGI
jgi:uncharacterized protein (TIGR00725 family)